MRCPKGYSYCSMRGMCVHKKRRSRFSATKAKKTLKKPKAPKAPKQRTVNILGAKKLLRTNYAELVSGKLKAPSFITTLKGVNGKNGAEKVANLRRVLSTCKKMGVPLRKAKGNTFKSYRTLVKQCKITFSKGISSSVLNQKRGKEANIKASALLESKLKSFKAKLAKKRMEKKQKDAEFTSSIRSQKPLLLENGSDEFYDSSPNFDYSNEYKDAMRTPLPGDLNEVDFGHLRNLRFGKKSVRKSKKAPVKGKSASELNKLYDMALTVPLPEFGRRRRY
jgi:hypothetical protein